MTLAERSCGRERLQLREPVIAPLWLGGALLFVPLFVMAVSPVWAGERLLVLDFAEIPCPGHVPSILEAAKLVPGVASAEVDFERSRGSFAYDGDVTDAASIVAAMPPDCPATVSSDGDRNAVNGDRDPAPASQGR